MTTKYRVGILGCTGTVGQRFIQLLSSTSSALFVIAGLGASERSAGARYGDASRHWILPTPCPAAISAMLIRPCDPKAFDDCDVIFSALDSSVAGELETAFAAAGFPVFSNSKNHRMDALVPLVVPSVNPDHLDMARLQRTSLHGSTAGFIVCNPNCSTTGLVVALKAIHDAFGLDAFMVTTLQAVSGAGYPGVASLDIFDNVIPYISGEEDKLETEPAKILGALASDSTGVLPLQVKASAMCNRVGVIDGHTECVSVRLKRREVTLDDFAGALRGYKPAFFSAAALPSLPAADFVPLKVFEEDAVNRPQPRLDRDLGNGYTVSVGRVRPCPVMDFKFVLLSHNTIIGAAGGAILNAEMAISKGLVQKRGV